VTGRLIDYYRRAESTGQLDWFVSANKDEGSRRRSAPRIPR